MSAEDVASLERPLPDGAAARLGTTRFRAPGSLERLALSPDGKMLVVSSSGRIYRYDAETGRPHGRSELLDGSVNQLEVLEGNRIYSSIYEKGIRYLDPTLKVVEEGFGHLEASMVVRIPGGGHVILDDMSRNLQLLGTDGVERGTHTVEGLATYVDVVASEDGKRIFVLANEREKRHLFHVRVFVISVETGEVVASGRLPEVGGGQIRVSPGGDQALIAGIRGSVHVFDVATESFPATASVHEGRTTAIAWSPNGDLCASASNGGNVVFYDSATLETKGTVTAHRGYVGSLEFSGDGSKLFSCGQDGRIRVIDPSTGADLLPLGGHEGPVLSLAWLPDASGVLTGSQDGRVILWGRDGKPIRAFFGNRGAVDAIAVSRKGDLAAFSGRDGSTQLIDLMKGEALFQMQVAGEAARGVAFSPSGDRIIVGSADGKGRIWSTATGEVLHTLDSGAGIVNSVAWSPDGQRVALGTSVVRLYEPKEGFLISELDGPRAPVQALSYTPMGDMIITASADRLVRVWSTDTQKEMSSVGGFTGRPNALSVSPDGRMAATCSYGDHGASVLDVEAGARSREVDVGATEVMAVSYSPDGQLLATGLIDGTTLLWKN